MITRVISVRMDEYTEQNLKRVIEATGWHQAEALRRLINLAADAAAQTAAENMKAQPAAEREDQHAGAC